MNRSKNTKLRDYTPRMLLRPALTAVLISGTFLISPRARSADWLDAYREPAARIVTEATSGPHAWERLAELTDTFGARLSGSENLERAIAWAVETMRRDGLENVRAEPVMVPRWVRGAESAEIVSPAPSPLTMLGLGGSVGTPVDGIQAETLVVSSFADLDARAEDAKGRIVVFNVPFTTYGETVQYRSSGPSRVAEVGGAAMLLRSVGPVGLRTPHTGALRYTAGIRQIPAAAISAEDADRLHRMQRRGTRTILRLRMNATFLPDVESANVVAEIRGREASEEVVVVGGHFDSWDVGTGATDDGGGCIATWEALRIVKALGLRPRRTLRVVLFTNEENGLRGALAYRDRYRPDLSRHVLMIESDGGVFRPTGFGFSGNDAARGTIEQIGSLLAGIDAHRVGPQGGGADIGPSVEAARIPAMSLTVDGNYFLVHHTPADTIDRIRPDEIARATAAIAVMAFVVAELPQRLGH
jgi:carboxypeptidase Q